MSLRLPAFHFPTTVVVVDDNPDFLSNIGLQLDPQLALRCFTSPMDALIAINGTGATSPSVERFFSVYADRGEYRPDRHVISINLDSIQDIVRDPGRFATVSVVVVDYDMPEIDGLEFCRNLRNPSVRKILLTGKADERTAVRAFNEGLIDRFIRKQEPDAGDILSRAIAELQAEYFQRGSRLLSDALAVGAHEFLGDPDVVAEFDRMRSQYRIVEHYLLSNPQGLLLLDGSANTWRLIVLSKDELRSQIEIARELGAPVELFERLGAGDVLPWFWRTGGGYSPEETDWPLCLFPARTIGRYLCALIPEPPGMDRSGLLSYRRYLEKLDAGQ